MGACCNKHVLDPQPLDLSTFSNVNVTGEHDPLTFLYVLACEHGMYYVGKTSNVRARYAAHAAGTGSTWTKAHKPLRLIECVPANTPTAEDALVKVYMLRHGIECVRGGSYAALQLTHVQLAALKNELCSATDTCFVCNATDHFASVCPVRERCSTCGRANHTAENCFCKTRVDANGRLTKRVCARCGRSNHTEPACFAKTHIDGITV